MWYLPQIHIYKCSVPPILCHSQHSFLLCHFLSSTSAPIISLCEEVRNVAMVVCCVMYETYIHLCSTDGWWYICELREREQENVGIGNVWSSSYMGSLHMSTLCLTLSTWVKFGEMERVLLLKRCILRTKEARTRERDIDIFKHTYSTQSASRARLWHYDRRRR